MDIAQQISELIIEKMQAKDGPSPYVLSVGLFEALTVQALHQNGKLMYKIDFGDLVIDDFPIRLKRIRMHDITRNPRAFKMQDESSVLLLLTEYMHHLFKKKAARTNASCQ